MEIVREGDWGARLVWIEVTVRSHHGSSQEQPWPWDVDSGQLITVAWWVWVKVEGRASKGSGNSG